MIRVPTVIRRSIAAACVLVSSAATMSCGSGDKTLGVADPLAAPLHPTYEQVRVILDRRCVSCHDAGDEEHNYSTCEGITSDLDGILDSSVFGGSMPPGALPRLTEREKLIIDRWTGDGALSPCNP